MGFSFLSIAYDVSKSGYSDSPVFLPLRKGGVPDVLP
jgi:hypothetical protein